MKRRQWSRVIATVTAVAMAFGGVVSNPEMLMTVQAETVTVTDAELDAALGSSGDIPGFIRNSVHDPSIVSVTPGDARFQYYVFGSHMGVSGTNDLQNWTSVTSEVLDSTLFSAPYTSAFTSNAFTGQVMNSAGNMVDFGTYNASAWNTAVDDYVVQGNMWAPDVIYNPTMNKWCMYLSLNGSKWNSNVILLTADNVEGPYVYQGPVIYSGFNVTDKAATDFSKTDLSLVYPGITELPAKYAVGNAWGDMWPHAIDPAVTYDEEGKLHLIYGSWSGGIYTIELDENTGLRDYTVKYEDVNAGTEKVTSDAYFGKKIAGGDYVSGEGAYVEKIGDYWYLFMSYGFYSPEGGYEMRIFRSDNVDGPYVDEAGNSAIFPTYALNFGNNTTTNGDKLMTGYQWDTMSKGEVAQGHNSAFTDANGNSYVIYHTKFNDGTVSHELRVHQLYQNEGGWLVAAPYEYTGETVNNSTLSSTVHGDGVLGSYEVVIHDYEIDYKNLEAVKPKYVTLNADGSVSGDYSGSWAVSNGSYITITVGGTAYKGVLVEQKIDGTSKTALCFTAKSAHGEVLWGSKDLGDVFALASTRDYLGLLDANSIFPVGGEIYQNVKLPGTGLHNTTVTWTSSNASVLSSSGIVTIPAEDTDVTMTCTLSRGGEVYQKSYNVTVMGASSRNGDTSKGLVAKFEFEGNLKDSINGIIGTAKAKANGIEPATKLDRTLKSTVMEVNFGYDGAGTSNYVEIPNPLKESTTGAASVSMVVKRDDSDVWDALWGFNGSAGRLFFTGNAYLGYNDNVANTKNWFDANHAATATNAIPVGEWSLVTVTVDGNGFDIYINGALVYTEAYTKAFGSGAEFKGYSSVADMIAATDTFYLGYGSFWGSAPFGADDLSFYDRALNGADVSSLYEEFIAKKNTVIDRTFAEIEQYKVYENDFEAGLGDATQVGAGEVKDSGVERHGKVYVNTASTTPRTNYLQLPSDVIADATGAGYKEMTVGFWVNANGASVAAPTSSAYGYFYAPLFSAYSAAPANGANDKPMMVLQSRLIAQVNCNGWTDFTKEENVKGVNKESTDWLSDNEWHYYTASFTEDQATVYVDGEVMNQWALSDTDGNTVNGLFTNGSALKYVCLGGNQAWNWNDNDAPFMYDLVSVYSTALSSDEVKRVMAEDGVERSIQQIEATRTYYNNFEEGVGDATIVGSGKIETYSDSYFNKVYHNSVGKKEIRSNYLLLPSDVMKNVTGVGTDEMTIGFWVNVADATDYWFSPIFTAYGAEPDATTGTNTWPMLALESRLIAQVNCAGWTNFTATENVAGANKETTVWLDDEKWHYYAATFTKDLVTVYVDGELQNQWIMTGGDGNSVSGIFTNGADLDYVCLGGNQAFDYGDYDPSYMFDKVSIFSTALTAGEIEKVMIAKEVVEIVPTPEPTPIPTPQPRDDREEDVVESFRTYFNDFEAGLGDATQVGTGAVAAVEDKGFGKVYHNATGELGVRKNYLLLPSDSIKNAAMAGNKQMSIGFWVNVANAKDYFNNPLFAAYGDAPTSTGNTWPMMILQSRLIGQVNCAGWANFEATENVSGTNEISTLWLDDAKWHYYTATFEENFATVYVDGVVKNQWYFSGAEGKNIAGLFAEGNTLDYVCLGGNQAWDWSNETHDKDAPYMFDDVAIYSTVLSAGEIADIMEAKIAESEATPTPTPPAGDTPGSEATPTPTPPAGDTPGSEATPTPTPPAAETPSTTETPGTTEAPEVTSAPSSTNAPTATQTPSATDAPVETEAPVPTEAPTATPVPDVSTETLLQETQEAIHELGEAETVADVLEIIIEYVESVLGVWAGNSSITNEEMSSMTNVEVGIREVMRERFGRDVNVDVRLGERNNFAATTIENALLTIPQGGHLVINHAQLQQRHQELADALDISAERLADGVAFDAILADTNGAEVPLDAPVRIHFNIPTEMQNQHLKMLHFVGDGAELLDVTVHSGGTTGSFITESFSEFVLVAMGEVNPGAGGGSQDNNSQNNNDSVADTIIGALSPKTGDLGQNTVAPWVQLVLLGIMCVAAALTGSAILRRKEEE